MGQYYYVVMLGPAPNPAHADMCARGETIRAWVDLSPCTKLMEQAWRDPRYAMNSLRLQHVLLHELISFITEILVFG